MTPGLKARGWLVGFCMQQLVSNYFLDGALPAAGTVCG